MPWLSKSGKTGTAQMVDPNSGRYSREKYISSFIGFPVDVEPQIVIFTSIVEPRGVYYAALTAAPLFREVLNSVANYCGLPAQTRPLNIAAENTVIDKLQFSKAAIEPIDEIKLKRQMDLKGKTVGWEIPSLAGLTPREVLRVLKGHRFHLEIVGTGVISSQTPVQGKILEEGNTIRLTLSEP